MVISYGSFPEDNSFTGGKPQFRETFHGILDSVSPPRMREKDRFIFAVGRVRAGASRTS